jgi:proteasome lid subunit RPN8/RPN11
MTAAAATPDLRQLQEESLPAGDFPVGGRQDFRVFFSPTTHEQIWNHASENVALEICGVLVGAWQRDAVGPFVTVSEFIRCDAAKSGFAEVTFTHEAWTKINAEMDTRLSGFKIVGWYHSHPDFGIFLSDRDTFIHQHFFSAAGQIAYVVDPVRKIDGVFAWQQGRPVLRPHFWVGERIVVTPAQRPADEAHGVIAAEPIPGANAGPRQAPYWLGILSSALIYLCVFVVGFLFGGRPAEWVRQLERQRDLLGIVVYFAERGILRPGLDENLEKLTIEKQEFAKEVDQLAREHLKLAGDDKESLGKRWDAVRKELDAAGLHLNRTRAYYVLAPDEQAEVKRVERQVVQSILEQEQRMRKGPSPDKPDSGGKEGESASDAPAEPDEKVQSPKEKSKPPATKPSAGSSAPGSPSRDDKRKPAKKE